MLPRIYFGDVAEGLVDRAALVPIGKLVGVVGAAGLTGLAAGDEHDGLIPICEVGDKTHGWAVMFSGGARAGGGARFLVWWGVSTEMWGIPVTQPVARYPTLTMGAR